MRFFDAALGAVFLCATGCGYVAGVQAPLANIPATVTDLDAIQRGSNLIAHFTVPALTTEGLPIRGALDFDLRAGDADVWFIGGARIYEDAMKYVEVID